MRGLVFLSLLGGSLMLQGCLAKAAFDVATTPVRVAGKAVDFATTSQSESDERRGREVRQREERLGKLQRRYEKEQKNCSAGDTRGCENAQNIYAEMQVLIPAIPVETKPR
ncbi:MAG: hypothetical protein WAT93_06430 [Pontixanthobacter sp.]